MATRQLEFNFDGNTADLERAFRESQRQAAGLERQVASLERQIRDYEAQLRRVEETQRRQRDTTRRQTETAAESGATTTGWILTMISAAAAVSPVAAAAAVSFGGFAAFAAPSIIKVITATQDLQANWETLSQRQRASAILVKNLSDNYHDLADSYEPEALQAFNSVVLSAHTLMPRLSKYVDQTGFAVQGFGSDLAAFVEGRQMGAFLDVTGKAAPQALDLLGDSIVEAGGTVTGLGQALVPAGVTLLTATRGVLGMANAAANANPLLTELVVTSLLLRAPTMALTGVVGRANEGMRAYAASTRGASLASRGLGLITRAGPTLYVAAAVALAYLAVRISSVRDATDGMIQRLQMEHKAYGNNIRGHRDMAAALLVAKAAAEQRAAAAQAANTTTVAEGAVTGRTTEKVRKLTEAYNLHVRSARNIEQGQAALSREFGITAESANRLATAAGVDMSKGILKSGELSKDAREKIAQYRIAVEAAANKTQTIKLALDQAADSSLLMKDRLTALQAALDAQFTPSLQAFQATTQLKEGFRQLGEQIGKAKGKMDGSNESSNQLRQTFAQQLASVSNLRAAELQRTGSLEKANAATARYLPILYAIAGGNKEARAQVDALARTMGFSVDRTLVSRDGFLRLAQSMGLTRGQAGSLWGAYQRLTGATNTGSTSITTYIGRLRTSAQSVSLHASRSDFGASRQQIYNSRVGAALPVLQALAGRNSAARAQVDALARATGNSTDKQNISRASFMRVADSMGIARGKAEQLWREYAKLPGQTDKAGGAVVSFSKRTHAAIHSLTGKDLRVTVFADGKFRRATTAGLASGGPVPASHALGPGGPKSDDVPLWGSVGEHMLTAKEVQAAGGHGAVYRMRQAMLRGEMRGYAVGGAITLGARTPSPGRVDQVATKAGAEHQRFIAERAVYELAESMAQVWKKHAALSGGSVVAAARSMIGYPYSWGGGGPGGPSYGIGRGAGTYGFDCSGLTEYAWWKGARVRIGGVTYSQHPNSRPIGGPRPGALGFNASLGHVVLASNKPGYVIEAPYTGAYVREVRKSMPDWRWPKGASSTAGLAEGGPVDRALGAAFLADADRYAHAKLFGLAGDPSGVVRYFAWGGIEPGYAHGPTLIGERGTGGEAYIPMSPARRPRSEALLKDVANRFGGDYTARIPARTGGAASRAQVIHHHKTINVMPHATNNLAEPVDIDLVAARLRFHEEAADFG